MILQIVHDFFKNLKNDEKISNNQIIEIAYMEPNYRDNIYE
jgi:hypothetical protein